MVLKLFWMLASYPARCSLHFPRHITYTVTAFPNPVSRPLLPLRHLHKLLWLTFSTLSSQRDRLLNPYGGCYADLTTLAPICTNEHYSSGSIRIRGNGGRDLNLGKVRAGDGCFQRHSVVVPVDRQCHPVSPALITVLMLSQTFDLL
jgi:hypothetical protein